MRGAKNWGRASTSSSEAPASGTDAGGPAHVQLLGRSGCHLCDAARDVVLRVAAEAGAVVQEVDVDTRTDLRERYSDLVPVVLVNGVEHSHWRVDEGRLRAALATAKSRRTRG